MADAWSRAPVVNNQTNAAQKDTMKKAVREQINELARLNVYMKVSPYACLSVNWLHPTTGRCRIK
jgi:hypothetical protein